MKFNRYTLFPRRAEIGIWCLTCSEYVNFGPDNVSLASVVKEAEEHERRAHGQGI